MANYTAEMQALEKLMDEQESKESAERLNVSQGSQIANMLTPLTNRSQGTADILMNYKPIDRSQEMTQAWTGGSMGRLDDLTARRKSLLDRYKTTAGLEEASQRLQQQKELAEVGNKYKEKALAQKDKQFAQSQALERQKMLMEASKKSDKGTVAEDALDRKFATTYNDYINEGGALTIDTNINKMKNVLNKLKTGDVKTGGLFTKITPTSGKSGALLNPGIVEVQQELESAIQNTLRPILGGQFAAIEGQQIMERAFNPNLDTSVNIKRIENEIKALEKRAKATGEAVAFYDQNRTLKGYKGGQAVSNITEQPMVASQPKKGGFSIINEAQASGENKNYEDLSDDDLDSLLGL